MDKKLTRLHFYMDVFMELFFHISTLLKFLSYSVTFILFHPSTTSIYLGESIIALVTKIPSHLHINPHNFYCTHKCTQLPEKHNYQASSIRAGSFREAIS